ncbi:cellulase family glycosylhydrolase [Saccharothrix lopnurensis]|uniref:Endoglucanase n=1 Tax=Saccharothrix lopnurensis TaxID=1670621 RepID=A0ABW1NYI8_9PSEU
MRTTRPGRARWRRAAALVAATALTALACAAATPAASAAPREDWLHVEGNQIVDEAGNRVWLTGANWFGFNATERVFHGLWSANIAEVTRSMADRGINIVRVPISTRLLLEWKNGQATAPNVNTHVNPELAGLNSLQVWDHWLRLCERHGLKVLLDVHSAEADNSGHVHPVWYKGAITTELFHQAWEWVTARYRDNDTIVAMDVKNEPHGTPNQPPRAKWDGSTDVDNWKHVCETAGRRVLAINPKVLILCEGVEVYPRAGETWQSPDTDPDLSPNYHHTWWGGNPRGVAEHPVDLGAHQDQLVYSPHDYGPLVFNQPWFDKPFTKESLIADVWRPNWLYLHEQGAAPLLIGEWGGRLGQDERQDRWMAALRDLIVEEGLHQTFWVLNPNSGDTGGLLLDDWKTWDETKYALLKPALWQHAGKFVGKFVGLDHQVRLGGEGSTTGISLGERYTDTGLTPNTRYSYALRAKDAAGNLSPATAEVTATTRPGTGGGSGCTAIYRTTTSRQGGFQAEVAVTNTGTASTRGWSVELSVAGGRTITSLWNGTLTGGTVTNTAHNGSLAPSASATFGFVANGQATGGVTAVSCTAT